MRIVSLAPGATEALFALGLGTRVVGVSHECDHPADAAALPRLTSPAPGLDFGSDSDPAAIDRAVSEAAAAGTVFFHLDEARLAELAPDLVVAQALCPVCAVTDDAVAGCRATGVPAVRGEVFSWQAGTLGGVLDDIERLGLAAGATAAAGELVASLRRRLDRVRDRARHQLPAGPRPRVVAFEWLDPFWIGGHWVPEMIEVAGGADPLGTPGAPSRRASWEEIAAADPDWIVAMPCGFDRTTARKQVAARAGDPRWDALRAVRNHRVAAVDGGGLFSRPGPRLVDGVERLAEILAHRSTVSRSDS